MACGKAEAPTMCSAHRILTSLTRALSSADQGPAREYYPGRKENHVGRISNPSGPDGLEIRPTFFLAGVITSPGTSTTADSRQDAHAETDAAAAGVAEGQRDARHLPRLQETTAPQHVQVRAAPPH